MGSVQQEKALNDINAIAVQFILTFIRVHICEKGRIIDLPSKTMSLLIYSGIVSHLDVLFSRVDRYLSNDE
jgi:hypothetical protein